MTRIQRHANAVAIAAFALIILVLSLSFSSCRSARPNPYPRAEGTDLPAQAAAPPAATPAPVAPAEAAPPKRRLLGLLPPAKATLSNAIKPGITQSNAMPRKCKGCTFITAAGDVSVAGKKAQAAAGAAAVTVAGKKAQAAKADSGAFIGQASARTQAAAGKDIAQTATTTKKSLLDYALPAVGIIGVGAALWFCWPWLLAFLRHRKSSDA